MRAMVINVFVASVLMTTAARAQIDKCSTEQGAVDEVNRKYELLYAAAERNPPPDGKGPAGDVTWTTKEISFDLPVVTMSNRTISTNLPQVTMKQRETRFKVPVTRMVQKKVGEKPRVKCSGIKCTVKWDPIYASVPEITMEERSISTKVPEFSFTRSEMVLKVPQFTKQRKTISFKYPEFTGGLSDSGTERAKEFENITAAHTADLVQPTKLLYECQLRELSATRRIVEDEFDRGIKELKEAVSAMQSAGADPTAVQTEGGAINLIAQLETVVAQRAEALQQLDTAINQLTQTLHETLRGYGVRDAA